MVPEGYIPKVGARIRSLQDPERKMSKSDPEDTYIAILDEPNVIRKKLRRAQTDSGNSIVYDTENKPGISNLMSILSAITGESMDAIGAQYDGKGYGVFKDAVADAVIAELEPIQKRYKEIVSDKAYLNQVMTTNAERARALSQKTLLKVRRKVGLAALKL